MHRCTRHAGDEQHASIVTGTRHALALVETIDAVWLYRRVMT